MKPDTRPGPQAKYSKHIVSNTDDKNVRDQSEKGTDAHSNPLGTVYVMKFPGGTVNCEFVCLGSYQALEVALQSVIDAGLCGAEDSTQRDAHKQARAALAASERKP